MEIIDHSELARKIYADLKKGIGNAVVWRLCDRYDISTVDLKEAIKASKGHLRNRDGIVEIVQIPKES